MKKFMELTALIEPVLKNSEALFDEGNKLDLTKGGEDFELEDIYFVLESYVAKAWSNPDAVVLPINMKDSIEKIWDGLWMMSTLVKDDVIKWLGLNDNNSFVKIKLEDRNRFKQLYLIKIVNEVCRQTYGFNLIAIL